METINPSRLSTTQSQAEHAVLLQWLLNPQSSNLTREHIQHVDWDKLACYYLEPVNQERLGVIVDCLCQNDYQQLRNHSLLPLLHHRLIPMMFTILGASTPLVASNQSEHVVALKNIAEVKKQRLSILLQLLTEQPGLMKIYFDNSPKALVNVLKLMQRWERESATLQVFTKILPHLFDLTLLVYLQLPRKPAYRFATLELRTLLLKWFKLVNTIISGAGNDEFDQTQFIRYFKTQVQRQHLLELIENRQLHELVPQHWHDGYSQSLPDAEADEPCILRSHSGLMRLWA